MRVAQTPGYWWDAIRILVGRELRIRYKGSVLGLLWASFAFGSPDSRFNVVLLISGGLIGRASCRERV